jgi:hypothetical protein
MGDLELFIRLIPASFKFGLIEVSGIAVQGIKCEIVFTGIFYLVSMGEKIYVCFEQLWPQKDSLYTKQMEGLTHQNSKKAVGA